MTNDDQLELLNKTAHEYFEEPHTCSLCGQSFEGWGHNPEPIKPYNRRCCNECNNTLVIPWRVRYGRSCLPFYLRCGFGKTDQLVFTPAARQRIDSHTDAEVMLKPGDLVEPLGGPNGRVYYGRKPDENDEIGQAVYEALNKSHLTMNGHHHTGVITQ